MLGLTATMDLFEQKKFSTSALVSQNAFAVGGSANLKTTGGVTLDTFSVGASYSTGPFFAAITTTKLSSATLAVKYEVSDTLKVRRARGGLLWVGVIAVSNSTPLSLFARSSPPPSTAPRPPSVASQSAASTTPSPTESSRPSAPPAGR